MLSNSTLKHVLAAALLFASASGFAQVTLGDAAKTPKTWAEVVSFLNNNTSNLDALQDSVTNAKNALDRVTPQTITQTVGWLQSIQSKANAFQVLYNAYNNQEAGASAKDGKIWTRTTTNLDDEKTLYIAFTEPTTGTWDETNVGDFRTSYTSKVAADVTNKDSNPIEYLYIYLGEDYKVNNGNYEVTTYTQSQQRSIISVVSTVLNTTLPSLSTFQETVPSPAYKTALDSLNSKENALTNAQNNLKAYNNLTLTGNVTATTAIANYAGTIIGNGYTFTAPAGGAVFTKFTGELSNAAVNGSFASSISGAKLDNVALLNNGKGTFYNANGVAADYATVGALAFAARDLFGVSNKALVPVEDANKVYSITVYTSPTEAPTYYVTVDGGKYTNVNNGNEVPVGDNVFVKSATNDLTLKNVFYNDGTATTVEITDRKDFYCPEDITATTVTYDRQFAEGHNAVCLPFAISSNNIDATLSVYSNTSDNKFWFNITEGTIAAHTPILMSVKTAGTLNNLNNVVIKKTESQIVAGKDGSYGLLKNVNTQEILGAQHTDVIYALSGGEFKWGGDNTVFPAFRMVIASVEANPASSYSIAFLNGNGGSGLSGIDEVSNDSDALEVIGGNGEITINSSVDCGNVAVYTIDGKVATNANVVAGTTTVNVAKGVYIVMGKKVLVK